MTHERRLIKKAEAHPLTPSIVSEAVLVDRAHDGDEQALTMLWFRFLPGLEAAVQAITHQRQDTEEILQDAFIRIMNGMETFEAGHAFFPWARKVCTNVALQRKAPAYVRRTSLSADIPGHVAGRTREVAPSSVDFYRNPEELAARNEGRELARAALPELTDYERGIAEMYYFNNMSAQDVADHLDVKVDTIKKHLVHIRKQVAAITQERGRLRRQAYEANQRTRPNAPLEQETEDQEMPIEHVIGALEDDREKDVARMRFVEKLPFLAIAKELGVSESTVMRWMPDIEQHLNNARKFLQLPAAEQSRIRAERAEREQRERELKAAAINQIQDPLRRIIMRLRYDENLTQVAIAARVRRTERTVQRQMAAGEEELDRLTKRLRAE